MTTRNPSTYHGTEQEKLFIDNLGSQSELKGLNRAKLLRQYMAAIQKRKTWESIDPGKIMVYLQQTIDELS
jgi:hypothetical protein